MLLARDDIRDRAVRLAGSSRIHITTVAMSDAGDRVSRYLLMQFIVNLGYGSLIALGLWGIGVPHPLLWGFTTFLLRFIPYVGILAAGLGPLLVAVAVSPDWKQVAWTFGLYFVVEVISANAVEPFLYGSSTGVSALAILIAAIFWTWLWGIAGLLLSTPLTVCLIVLGRHVPTLAFVGVLFGEENVLAPSQRLYQRILAGDATDSNRLVEEQIHSKSRQEVYDGVLIPALSLVEAARHSEEINSIRAEQALQSFEDLVEEQWGRDGAAISAPEPVQRMVCVPARDFADEIACQLLTHVATASHRSQVLGADLQSADAIQAVTDFGANVVCIVGIPPQAVRHVRLRCHQIRARFPEMTIIACVLSGECDLPSIRSRIPLEDAQHVACSLLQATAYLAAMANPTPAVVLEENAAKPPEPEEAEQAVVEAIDERKQLELLDETEDDIFDRIASNLARSFEAPIALLSVRDANGKVWSAQCGLPGDDVGPQLHDLTICNEPNAQQVCVVIADTADDERFSHDPFLQEKGIRFLAGAPVMADDGREIGSLCVMDTRPRQITEQQRAVLVSLAEAVTNAVELRSGAAAEQVQ
jgi:GAF domain-containing protein